MDTTESIYISDMIDEVVKHTDKDYETIEREFFNLYLYPAGENTSFDSSDNHKTWLPIAIAEILKKQNLEQVMFYE